MYNTADLVEHIFMGIFSLKNNLDKKCNSTQGCIKQITSTTPKRPKPTAKCGHCTAGHSGGAKYAPAGKGADFVSRKPQRTAPNTI